MEVELLDVEVTEDGTIVEVMRIVDVRDAISPVRLRIREWIDERHYRDVEVAEKFRALYAANSSRYEPSRRKRCGEESGKVREGAVLVRIIEHSQGYYECQEVPRGSEYVWRPECFVLACGCGEEAVLLGLLGDAQCPCGADLAAFVRGKRRAGTGEKRDTNHPWRSSYRVRSSTSRNSEYNTWQELRTLE